MRTLRSLGFLLLLASTGWGEYLYEDNVSESLKAGTEAFRAGRFSEAAIELENVLLMAPGSVQAHEVLIQVYAKQGKGGLGQRLLKRARRGGLLDSKKVSDLEALFSSGTQIAAVQRGHLFDGGAPRLPPAGALTPTGIRRQASVKELETIDLGDGLDDLLDDLEGPAPIEAPPAPVKPTGNVPTEANPYALHAYAVALYRKSGSAVEAGKLFVQALQAQDSLLAENDGGLFDATYTAYKQKLKTDPDNFDARFILAFLEEKRGDNEQAIVDYRKVAEKAPGGSKLGQVAKARADLLEADLKRQAAEEAALRAQANEEKEKEQVAQAAEGNAEGVETPEEYRNKGRIAHKKFDDSRDLADLEAAASFYQGAIAKEPANGENHYRYALVKIDMATEGVEGARDAAKDSLEKSLALNPPQAIRIEAENMLKALTRR